MVALLLPCAIPGAGGALAQSEPDTTSPPPEARDAAGKRGRVYVAPWLGYGGGNVHGSEVNTGFIFYLGIPVPLSAGVGVGVPAGQRVLVGAEWNITLGINCVASMDEASGACDRVVLLQHLLATATFFPLWEGTPEVAPAGLFVRGGAGLALLNSWPEDIASTSESATAEPGARWKRTGAGVLTGLGYALRIGESRTRTLDLGLDVAWQWYGSSASEPERSFSAVLRCGVTFH
jgi:hypothetical protein